MIRPGCVARVLMKTGLYFSVHGGVASLMTILLLPAARAQGISGDQSLVVPPELASSFGETGVDPFFFENDVQFVYAGSAFRNSPTDELLITGVSFRADESTTGGSFDTLIPSLFVYVGVYKGGFTGVNGLLLNSDNNTVVFDQTNVRFQSTVGLGFNFAVPFDRPFYYNRRDGALLIHMSTEARGSGPIFGFDAQLSNEGLFNFRAGTDIRGTLPVIVAAEFAYSSVPEPTVLLISTLGLVTFFARRRRGAA